MSQVFFSSSSSRRADVSSWSSSVAFRLFAQREQKSFKEIFFLGGASQLANEQLNEEMRPIKVIAIVMMVIMTMSHRVSCFSFIFLALGKNTIRWNRTGRRFENTF